MPENAACQEDDLKAFLEDALTSPDPSALDDALEVMQAIKQKRLARKGICPCCGRKTDDAADIPVRNENGETVGWHKVSCACAEKRKTCLRCATDDALRGPFLCDWCVKVDKIPHCVLCKRPKGLVGPMCAVCEKDVSGNTGAAMVDPASPAGQLSPHSAAEFAAGLGQNMKVG